MEIASEAATFLKLHVCFELKRGRLWGQKLSTASQWSPHASFTAALNALLSIGEALVSQRQRWQRELFYKVCEQINEVDEWVSNKWSPVCG